jgi:hypothetical protein
VAEAGSARCTRTRTARRPGSNSTDLPDSAAVQGNARTCSATGKAGTIAELFAPVRREDHRALVRACAAIAAEVVRTSGIPDARAAEASDAR